MKTSRGSHRVPADPHRAAKASAAEAPAEAAAAEAPVEAPTEAPAEAPTEVPAEAPAAGPRPAPGPRPGDGLRRFVPQALVVAVLAGGTSAFVVDDKAIRLSVDGAPRTLHTFADDVGELLAAEGIAVSAHDLVAPAPRTALADGDEVAVRRARPLDLDVDGRTRHLWTTARTVDEALRELGVRAEGAHLSASRSAAIGRTGLALAVRTERAVTFLADGRQRTVRTNAASVAEALARAGITLRGQDTTSVPPDAFPRDGQTVTVLRVRDGRETREEAIPYAVRHVDDPDLYQGTEVVDRQGRPGLRRITYETRTVNGVRRHTRRTGATVVREPVARIVRVGTGRRPASVSGTDGLNWAALAWCESGNRPDAVDPSGTYGGLYQFDLRTWRSLGGAGRPQDASAAEQTYRAKKLYVQRGASPWPHCGRRLYR
ncbi:ubiquitin-like domain-containing protein [Streptomyces roseolilacinus]|uniref:ubiquitin-like domain-containing protein n=1 Tax=Streptomyces roseolilacinus TaxID=66904 RepID=UPI0037F5FF04